ncbi:MAG: radical SAM protein [Candidatus Brocadia sp.]|nr:radical SAM protein [Candidatus Brocadia sp.]MDG6027770.1 radical SAM protein [Candidatus Brocadia sp.]
MPEINEVTINRILNPTSIDLGEYVINPYMGCEFACTYCYVRSNKAATRRKIPWGSYVDIRVNAPDLLEREILEKHPGTVLLGSTTECFQPVEKKFRLTRKMLEILNKHKVSYVILTRSPYIAEYVPLLNQEFCKRIYFTVNPMSNTFKQLIEPKSPPLDSRNDAIHRLLDAGISVIPYYSPVIPWVTDIRNVFPPFAKAERIEFEYLNFNLHHAQDMVRHISLAEPALGIKFTGMVYEKAYYEQTWNTLDEEIARQAREANKKYKIHRHPYGEFFQNTYFS